MWDPFLKPQTRCFLFFKFNFWRRCWVGRLLLPFVDSSKIVCFYFFSLLTPSCDSTKLRMWKKPTAVGQKQALSSVSPSKCKNCIKPHMKHELPASLWAWAQKSQLHLLLPKPTTFLIKADATYALALGCQWDGLTSQIAAFWRPEWGHGILPLWRSSESLLWDSFGDVGQVYPNNGIA